ncbi:MAG: ORF6N domain-containing protein [Proteobacteria bacterium]|nr:ORF6N domain-containing protein [Pseudomonadota bacterium]
MRQNQELIQIEDKEISLLEYRSKPVITLRMVDELHERPESTARQSFNRNKERFIENEDYFFLPYEEWEKFLPVYETYGQNNRSSQIFLTQSGYLLLVKVFNDDLSWKIQRALVKSYFTIKTAHTLSQSQQTMRKERLFLTEKRRFEKLVEAETRRIFNGESKIEDFDRVPILQQAVKDALEKNTFELNRDPLIKLLESIRTDFLKNNGLILKSTGIKVDLTEGMLTITASSREMLTFSERLSKAGKEINPFATCRQLTAHFKMIEGRMFSFNWIPGEKIKIVNGNRRREFRHVEYVQPETMQMIQ